MVVVAERVLMVEGYLELDARKPGGLVTYIERGRGREGGFLLVGWLVVVMLVDRLVVS